MCFLTHQTMEVEYFWLDQTHQRCPKWFISRQASPSNSFFAVDLEMKLSILSDNKACLPTDQLLHQKG